MTYNEARKEITRQLSSFYDADELKNIADLVLEYITAQTRTEQVKNKKAYLTCIQLENLDAILERLKKNEPVQYVLGEAWFAGMKFKVNKNVLIPRPETEELVEWVVREFRSLPAGQAGRKSGVRSISILDVGTGSGCIAISLKKKLPKADIAAIDICSEALFTATENAIALDAEIKFELLDFLDEEKWKELGLYDIIVSNPPYVRQSESTTMHERVTGFEPRQALFVPDNEAFLFYRKLSAFAKHHLNPGGSLFVEINEKLGKKVVDLFQSTGLKNVELRKDMQGKDRMVKGVYSL
jgi:release factor glutamine methyltransferase